MVTGEGSGQNRPNGISSDAQTLAVRALKAPGLFTDTGSGNGGGREKDGKNYLQDRPAKKKTSEYSKNPSGGGTYPEVSAEKKAPWSRKEGQEKRQFGAGEGVI